LHPTYAVGGGVDDWDFYQHTDGKWSWRNVKGDAVGASSIHFETFAEAVADATRHGFQAGVSKIASITADRRTHPR